VPPRPEKTDAVQLARARKCGTARNSRTRTTVLRELDWTRLFGPFDWFVLPCLRIPDLGRGLKQMAGDSKPQNILIEDKGSGTQLIQDLNYEGLMARRVISQEIMQRR
jgi:hypothetical protein